MITQQRRDTFELYKHPEIYDIAFSWDLSEEVRFFIRVVETHVPFPVKDFDDEYLRGSRLEPKRRMWIDSNELVLSRDDDPEIERGGIRVNTSWRILNEDRETRLCPLSANEIDTVRQICESTSRNLGLMDS